MPELDILSQLPHLKWRDIEVPAQANSLSFEHGLVEHRQHGVDGAHQENTGRGSRTIQFRIPFRTGIINFPELYPTTFRDFWNACNDGSVGNLIHPEFGEFDAKVASFALSVVPERRDGYDVDVVFRETTENNLTAADNPLGPITNAISIAQAFEEEAKALSPTPEYDDGSGVGLLTALKQLDGSLRLAELTVAGKISQLNNVINAVNDMVDTANKSTQPESWAVTDAFKEIWANLQEAKDTIAPEHKRIDFVVAPRELTASEAAAGHRMEIDDFFRLNPKLARTGIIPVGDEYFVYK